MLSRRRFLAMSGLGMVSFSAACQPRMFQRSASGAENGHDALERLSARSRAETTAAGLPDQHEYSVRGVLRMA